MNQTLVYLSVDQFSHVFFCYFPSFKLKLEFWNRLSRWFSIHVCQTMEVRICQCLYINTHTQTHTNIYINVSLSESNWFCSETCQGRRWKYTGLEGLYLFSCGTVFGIKRKKTVQQAKGQRVYMRKFVSEWNWRFSPHVAEISPCLFITNLQ